MYRDTPSSSRNSLGKIFLDGGAYFGDSSSLLVWSAGDRYEHSDDGLGNSTVNYIAGAAFSLRPKIVLTVDDLASAGTRPVLKFQLLFAGPWYQDRLPPGTMPLNHADHPHGKRVRDAHACSKRVRDADARICVSRANAKTTSGVS